MLDVLRRGQRWIMPALLIGIGVPFVVYFGAQSGPGGGPVMGPGVAIRIGDRSISSDEVREALDFQIRQYREALGEQFDESAALPFLVQAAASGLLRNALLAHLGEEMGLSVSDAELQAFVARQPWSIGENGQYDPDQVRRVIERQFGSERVFTRRLSADLLAAKTERLIGASVAISDAEARDAIRFEREEVRVLAVRLDGSQPRAEPEVPEDAGKALAAQDPERVRKAVDDRRSELDTPEQLRARHILVSVPPSADDAARSAARAKIDAARQRIEAGEDFAAVAKEVSEDPGSKENGGDLGFFPRGAMVAAFEEAAFALEPGKLSDVVETPFGLHLILVEEKKQASELPYSEASARVAQELARIDAASALAKQEAKALAAALEAGQSLEGAAREQGANILRPAAFRRRADGFIPEIGISPELMDAAFALTPERRADGVVYEVGENVFVLVELLEKKTPTDAEIEAALPLERERVLGERRNAVEQAWLEGERKRLERARCLGIPVQTPLAELNSFVRPFCSSAPVVDLSELLPASGATES